MAKSAKPKTDLMVAEKKVDYGTIRSKRNASAIKQGRQANDAIVGAVIKFVNTITLKDFKVK